MVLGLAPLKGWAQVGPWQITQATAGLGQGGPALLSFLNYSAARSAPPDFVYQVLKNARSLQDQGLPPSPYLLKANEGLAKGVPHQKMAPILKETQDQTLRAGRWVDQAVARGWKVKSPGQRRRLAQEYQWALLNQIPPAGKVPQETHPEPSGWGDSDKREAAKGHSNDPPRAFGTQKEAAKT